MNTLDLNYQLLLNKIIIDGTKKGDRTGTGTISIFGHTIRHNMSRGFPLLTTKKIHFKSVVTELIWFLQGGTNIKYLVDNNCNIWNGDAYKKYLGTLNLKPTTPQPWQDKEPTYDTPLTPKEFAEKIKSDNDFANIYGELGPTYGKQWREWESNHLVIDQIAELVNDLKTNPNSRRLMVNAWKVDEVPFMTLPPCHYGFQLYTRDATLGERIDFVLKDPLFDPFDFGVGPEPETPEEQAEANIRMHEICDTYHAPHKTISLMWNQRSVDTFLGLPFNIASYGLLLLILAQEVNMIPRELIGNLGDTHLYQNHIDQAFVQLNRSPFKLPTVNIKKPAVVEGAPILSTFQISDFELVDYQSHDKIEAALSN
jgi:thymidylate synthase